MQIPKLPYSIRHIGYILPIQMLITNRFSLMLFLPADLVHWKKHEHILDTASIKWAKRAMWAPAIVEKDSKYFLFFGANDIQSDNEYGGIGDCCFR
jgi:hypothetical protein